MNIENDGTLSDRQFFSLISINELYFMINSEIFYNWNLILQKPAKIKKYFYSNITKVCSFESLDSLL